MIESLVVQKDGISSSLVDQLSLGNLDPTSFSSSYKNARIQAYLALIDSLKIGHCLSK